MKAVLTFLAVLLLAVNSNGQTIPNAGFEN
jgi:hypothetical protein